jgi:hypothetical protein
LAGSESISDRLLGVVILPRRKDMAEPIAEKSEKKLEETVVPTHDSELSDADVAKVSGGVIDYKEGGNA